MGRLAELETFIAIVDTGGLASAARRLGRSPPAVTRLLAMLEARVGQTLIERTTRRCRPTDAGERFAEQVRQLLSIYEEAIAEAAGEVSEAKGVIRMTAPLVFGRQHVAPAVNRFLAAHPAISIDLQLSDGIIDLYDSGYDLALRIGPLEDSSLIARKLGEVRRILVASPDYLRSRGEPRSPDELGSHDIIQRNARGIDAPWEFLNGGKSLSVKLTGRLVVNQSEAAVDAARDSRGLVRVLSYQAAGDLKAGRLVRILRDYEPQPLPVHLVWPASRRSWRRIRMLIDFLAGELAKLDVIRPESST